MEAGLFVSQLETLLPLATAWAAEQGEIILREGVPLTGTEMGDARKVGVREPERIRLLCFSPCAALGYANPWRAFQSW